MAKQRGLCVMRWENCEREGHCLFSEIKALTLVKDQMNSASLLHAHTQFTPTPWLPSGEETLNTPRGESPALVCTFPLLSKRMDSSTVQDKNNSTGLHMEVWDHTQWL